MAPRGDVTVVAGGWSVANVAIDRLPGVVIAVNDAALHLPRWDHALSMDRLWAEARVDRVRASPAATLNAPIWIRRSAAQNLARRQLNGLHVFDCDNETDDFTDAPGHLNGRSSGTCALNLAWTLQPARLFLLGFDMNRSPSGDAYWYPPYPWSSRQGGTSNGKYGAWARGLERAREQFDAAGCEVFNVSPTSAIVAFRRITPAEFRKLAP